MKTLFTLLLLLGVTASVWAQPAGERSPLASDLAAVPNDAFLFGHVKIADLWKNDALKDVRMILLKAGSKALDAFDKRYTPSFSSLERLTVYAPLPDFNGPPNFMPVFILALNQPVEQKAFLKQFPGKVTEKKGKIASYFVAGDDLGVRFIDTKTFAIGPADAIANMCDTPLPKKAGPLTPALELANGNRPLIISLNASLFPQEEFKRMLEEVPPPLRPLLAFETVTLSLDLEKDGNLYAQVIYPDKKVADEAEKALKDATVMLKKMIDDTRKELEKNVLGDGKDPKLEELHIAALSLLGLGALQHAEDLLKAEPVKRVGNSFNLALALPPHFKSALGTLALAGASSWASPVIAIG